MQYIVKEIDKHEYKHFLYEMAKLINGLDSH